MANATKLTDLQLILLSHAAARDSRSIFPLPDTISDRQRADRELKALLKRALVAESESSKAGEAWRRDGDLQFALTITEAGLTVIGLGEGRESGNDAQSSSTPAAPSAQPTAPRSASKIAAVIELLRRSEGATLADLVAATSWLPHTTRAALTGLRKKGHVIGKAERDGATCYRIAEIA